MTIQYEIIDNEISILSNDSCEKSSPYGSFSNNIDEENNIETSFSDIFLLDIKDRESYKYTENEIILIVLSILSLIGIPIILIPFLCNHKIFNHLIYILKNNILLLPFYILVYLVAIVYHYVCILLYPFIMMVDKL